MRIAAITAALVVSSSLAAAPAEPIRTTAATPPSVALILWCRRFPDAACRLEAADAARERCRVAGTKARFVRSALLQRTFTHGQEGWFLFDCIR
jgi:hypothetical protein